MKSIRREILIASATALILTAVFAHIPVVRELSATLIAAIFILIPFAAVRFAGVNQQEMGLDFSHWREDIKLFLLVSLIVFPLYTLIYIPYLGFVFLSREYANSDFWGLLSQLPEGLDKVFEHWQWRLMPAPVMFILSELIITAIPEELFFRGYLQGRLDKLFGTKWGVIGVKIGWGIFIASAFFALLHIVSIPAFFRLGVFFPALLFGWMRSKTGSILAPVLFHVASNCYTSFMDYALFGR